MYQALFQHLLVYCPLERLSLRNSQMYILLMSCVSGSSPALFALNKSWQCPLTRDKIFLVNVFGKILFWLTTVTIPLRDCESYRNGAAAFLSHRTGTECVGAPGWMLFFLLHNLWACLSSEFLESMKGGKKCIGRIIVRCHIKCHWDISVTQTFTFSHL